MPAERRGARAAIALLAAAPLAAWALELHVGPTGDDAAGCTAAEPCRQIRRALELVAAGDRVVVAPGEYLGFTVEGVVGTADAPIVIEAPAGGAVVTPTTDRGTFEDRDSGFNVFGGAAVVAFEDWTVRMSLAEWQAAGHEAGSLEAALADLFVDATTPGARDYHLPPDSPAVDAGETLAVDRVDHEGRPRPLGAESDAGAHESGDRVMRAPPANLSAIAR